jgi:hypothetical protein
MDEANPPISTGCSDDGTATLLGSGSASLASSTRYWYIDNKGIRIEKMFRKVSCRWFFRGAFRVFYKADRSVGLARVTSCA